MTVLIAAGIILIIFCIALRLKNKPENVAKRREQKRLMKEKKIRRENEKALLSITEEFLRNPENRGPVDYEFRCMRNPYFNIESDEYFELHMKRLEQKSVSQYQGKEYHKDKKGEIYILSADGTKNYKY
tara:strand:+ start:114 stop:500 length:387 start_codon:yes stop_codon:yes gene_type:complete